MARIFGLKVKEKQSDLQLYFVGNIKVINNLIQFGKHFHTHYQVSLTHRTYINIFRLILDFQRFERNPPESIRIGICMRFWGIFYKKNVKSGEKKQNKKPRNLLVPKPSVINADKTVPLPVLVNHRRVILSYCISWSKLPLWILKKKRTCFLITTQACLLWF